jgi:hypothetical protein
MKLPDSSARIRSMPLNASRVPIASASLCDNGLPAVDHEHGLIVLIGGQIEHAADLVQIEIGDDRADRLAGVIVDGQGNGERRPVIFRYVFLHVIVLPVEPERDETFARNPRHRLSEPVLFGERVIPAQRNPAVQVVHIAVLAQDQDVADERLQRCDAEGDFRDIPLMPDAAFDIRLSARTHERPYGMMAGENNQRTRRLFQIEAQPPGRLFHDLVAGLRQFLGEACRGIAYGQQSEKQQQQDVHGQEGEHHRPDNGFAFQVTPQHIQ